MRKARSETGLTARQIHYYEEEGLIGEVERSAGNHRLFYPDQIDQLREIAHYRSLDFSIRELEMYLDPDTSQEDLAAKADELERLSSQAAIRARLFRQAAEERRLLAV